MMWEMIMCLGITWAGCGSYKVSVYPSEASCYKALQAVRDNSQPVAESNKKLSMVAYCRPVQEKRP